MNPCQKNKKNILFEDFDTQSIQILSLTNDIAKTYLEDFTPVRWWRRSFNALAYLPSSKMKMKINNNNNNNNNNNKIIYDAVYVATDKNHLLLVLYITPHLIFNHIDSGQSTLDILYRSALGFESIAISPKYKFRSIDNKSVEFVVCRDDELKVKSLVHPSLGLFCEKERQNYPTGRLLNKYLEFVDKIYLFFSATQYLPYMVHPYRLILFEDDELKLISCNLMHYLYYPYMTSRKLSDIHFSYPDGMLISTYNSPAEMLMHNSVQLVLDFLHSVFVTALWISRPIGLEEIFMNHHIITSYNKDNDRVNKRSKKDHKIIDPFWIEPRISCASCDSISSGSCSSSNKRYSRRCQNPYGYCLAMKSDLVHEYGCSHLLSMAPNMLISAVNNASEKEDKNIFTNCVLTEISVIKTFISEIIKNNEYDT